MKTTPRTVAVAICNTSYFLFVATGDTPDLARAVLLAAWRAHAAETGGNPRYLDGEIINVVNGPVGTAFRDWDVYPRLTATPAPAGAWEDRHIGRGEHVHCESDDHDREASDDDLRDERGRKLCNGCRLPAFYCGNTGTYHHVDPDAPECFLIPD